VIIAKATVMTVAIAIMIARSMQTETTVTEMRRATKGLSTMIADTMAKRESIMAIKNTMVISTIRTVILIVITDGTGRIMTGTIIAAMVIMMATDTTDMMTPVFE